MLAFTNVRNIVNWD